MTIKYGIGPSSVGKLLVAKSEKGLCAVQVRGTEEEMERSLRERYADTIVLRDEKAVAPLRKLVLASIAGKPLPRKLDLDIQGTEFQRSVWSELRRIPSGATRSYADIAKAIGKPNATRAVANACGANPLPVLVPCHRVIAKDGTIGGYTGGLKIKRALLDAEGVRL
ncbi:MAG: methylated-DNA--[protein]-cysteine S-methyltransferase [Gemmatimonadota bacterium]|nr:methylated-DNA--[protein]-cysteine S-methyltransferase [Gemmatimonadota bacterium]